MSDNECRWDGCDDPQWEDWFYCEYHASKMALVSWAYSQIGVS